jgi:uncharacterized protein (DUF362 family)
MTKITRREFLRALAAGVSGVALDQFIAACSQKQPPPSPPATQIPPQAATQALSPTESVIEPSESLPIEPTETMEEASPTEEVVTTPAGLPDLVVARRGEPEEMVRQALKALGGIERFVPQGASVIIKPNICVAYHTYEYAATTNPWVVGALVRLCLEAGTRSVQVMDNPFGGSPQEAYARSGIGEQVQAASGEMVAMSGFKFIRTEIPQGVDLREKEIYDDVLQADVLIDVPIAKHHNLARLTLGMKNLMGVINARSAMHSNLGQRLADLTTRVYPTLTVVDAVRALMDHGPTGGSLEDVQQMDTVIASPDIVAADSYAATLFGLRPDDLAYVRAGVQLGLGRSDLENLKIEEIAVGA